MKLNPFLLAVAHVWFGGWTLLAQDQAVPEVSPNLLIIYTDEHHYNTLGCYGGHVVETPHIDWLAENGALCGSFYATTPVCSPSRGSLVSGKYPQNTPVTQNNIRLADDTVTFASVLRQKGYATGFAGKWHLDGFGKPQWAPERKFGFEDNRYMFNRGHWKQFKKTDQGPRVAARNDKGQPAYGVEGADEKSFATDWLVDRAVDFIGQHKNRPFCYMVSLPDPHGPNTVRPPYNTMYVNAEVPIPVSLTKKAFQIPAWATPAPKMSPRVLRGIMPQYYGMVKCIDDNVGRLLDTLREQKLLQKTFIVFTSDHGDLCGEHGRLNKGVPYEGSARVPFLLYGPGVVPPGTRIDQALGSVDFMPTILSLLGAEGADAMEGRDASPLFRGKDASSWDDITFLRSTSGNNVWIAAVSDSLKLVFSANDKPWLFDLELDPDEMNNHFQKQEYQARVQAMAQKLIEYGRRFEDPYLSYPKIIRQVKAAATPL